MDGTCNCPEGYAGANCENFDLSMVQLLLNAGVAPLELFNGGVPLDSLYGKTYSGGLIFYLDTLVGTGLVADIKDIGTGIAWGCQGVNIPNLNDVNSPPPLSGPETEEGARIGDGITNTIAIIEGCGEDQIAAKFCQAIGPEWFLPSRYELRLMYNNLHLNGYGNFITMDFYFSSTEINDVVVSTVNFSNGSRFHDNKGSFRTARAAKAY